MRTTLTAVAAAAAGLVIANMLGVAGAEAPTGASSTAVRSVKVEGVANVPIEQGASAAAANAAYRQGMANAIADGLNKAEFLASKAGVTLGPVQSLSEGGGSIECKNSEPPEGSNDWAQYTGEQPDFGNTNSGVVFARAAPRAAKQKATSKRPKLEKGKGPAAKKSTVAPSTCELATQVSLVYAIS